MYFVVAFHRKNSKVWEEKLQPRRGRFVQAVFFIMSHSWSFGHFFNLFLGNLQRKGKKFPEHLSLSSKERRSPDFPTNRNKTETNKTYSKTILIPRNDERLSKGFWRNSKFAIIRFFLECNLIMDPVVYLKSPVWDFGGGSWLWNWSELNVVLLQI